MAVKETRVLKEMPNEDFLKSIWDDASPEYQARITEPTKAGIQQNLKELQAWRPSMNEFEGALVNRIGLTHIQGTSYLNPMAEFKCGKLEHGDTIEEIQIGLTLARAYDTDREELEKMLFGTHANEVQTNFHKLNRRDVYPITINTPLLANAFDSTMGLSQFTTKLMGSVSTSDNWDEFLAMCQLFSEYEANGGYFKIQVPDVARIESSEADAKETLRKIRSTAKNLTFVSRRYNPAKMPMHVAEEDLILFCTPEFEAAMDVEALAGAFNIDKARATGRIFTIPEEQFNIEGCQAIMTTKNFFVVADSIFETASQWNPAKLQTNYFLHRHQVISASRFTPVVMFTTHAGDAVIKVNTPVTSVSAIEIKDRDDVTPATVDRGQIYSLFAEAVTSDGTNNGVRWTVAGQTSPMTYVSRSGVLHVGGNEGADTLTVTATATWLDPSNVMRNGATSTKTLTVSGEPVPLWPSVDDAATATDDSLHQVTGITVEGVAVSPAFAPGTLAYTVIVPGGTTTVDDVEVAGPDAGDVDITLNATNDVVTISVPSAPGDPVYTITVN